MTQHYQIVFDDRCALCRAWMRWINQRDAENKIQPLSCNDYRKLVGQTDFRCDSVRLITPEGVVFDGGEAIPQILRLLPGFYSLGKILGWRIMSRPLSIGYRILSRNRLFLSAVLGKW